MVPLTPRQWVICAIAAIGFAFDIYEILMLPLIARPALMELTGAVPGTPAFNYWVGMLFWVPAMAGGVFGLIGGYLADRFGRRRVLVWSILLYAFSACAAGYATSIGWLLFFRCTTFIGVCVEFVAAVAWLAELFPDPKQREAVLGYTQAFSSVGGILVTGAYFLAVTYAESLPAIHGGARALAVHVDLRPHPRAAAHHRPAIPAGVAGVAGAEGRRHARSVQASSPSSRRSTAGRRSSPR